MTEAQSTPEALAVLLDDAQRHAVPIEQLSARSPLDISRAYAVQHALIARRLARGDELVGLKLGFTSRAKAQQMGVDDLILGSLTREMRIEDGGGFDVRSAIHPRVEPEIAYLLAPNDPTRIVAVAPALEFIDSRYRDFRFDLGDVVADNTSAAGFVLGPWQDPASVGRLDNRAVVLQIDGRIVQSGSTAAILGDPARAIGSARRLAGAFGFADAGRILLAGAATAAVPVPASGVVEATITGLGRVSVRIGKGEQR